MKTYYNIRVILKVKFQFSAFMISMGQCVKAIAWQNENFQLKLADLNVYRLRNKDVSSFG